MPSPALANQKSKLAAVQAKPVASIAKSNQSSTNLVGKLVGLVLGVALLATLFLNRVILTDWIKGLRYSPTAGVSEIESALNLTSSGTRIFRASLPKLESRDEFNRDCKSFDVEVSVLGCYTNEKIYVYNVEEAELAGIRESTAAHELLHAAYARLSDADKAKLKPSLDEVYRTNESALEPTLKSYAEAERAEELYVRAATQIAALPADLETHYAHYFANRQKLVEFYNNYITPFKELRERITTLGLELNLLREEIDAKTDDYESRSEKFSSDVDEFNDCANTSGCFSSDYEFSTRRRKLVAEQESLDELYDSLNSLIDDYNSKVDEYNSNVLRSNDLQGVINSNSERKEM